MSVEDVYAPGTVLDIPKRPPWSYSMSKEELERQEEAMFKDYLEKIYSQHRAERLSYFEHNLEVSDCVCVDMYIYYTQVCWTLA